MSDFIEPAPALQVVLVTPEIPQNTGSIARLCAATHTRLHLIRPLGFSLDDRYLKRAGLDYWPWVDVTVHDSWSAFLNLQSQPRCYFYSARSDRAYTSVKHARGDYLVFGCETKGLPRDILDANRDNTYVIPIVSPHVRSLNLSNAVSVVAYEAFRQIGGPFAHSE